MNIIEIKHCSVGDTRTANHAPTIEEFSDANALHIKDVKSMVSAYGYEIAESQKGNYWECSGHDWTKQKEPYKSEFYHNLCDTINGHMDFMDGEWIRKHYDLERHHLNDRCPDDVTLIDVIEMIADNVCAGLARSGEIRPVEIKPEVLALAVKNTAEFMAHHVKLTNGSD